jgi:hypothetical protein
MKLRRFKNRTPARFEYMYCTLFPLCHSNKDMYPFIKDASVRSYFCFVHTIAQFSRILRFSHIYCQIFRREPFVDESDVPLNSECINFNDRLRKVQKNYYFGAIFWNHDQEKKKYDAVKTKISLIFFIMISHYTQVCVSSEGLL